VTDYRGPWGGGAWNQDGVIVFGGRTFGLFRVPASGGAPVQITAVAPEHQEILHYGPSFLPDGRHFIYARRYRDPKKSAIYLGSVDAKPEQQSAKPLVASDWPGYAPSADPGAGYLLFVREETLMAQAFDNRRLELTGQPVPVAEPISDGRAFSTSSNGVLVFLRNALIDRQLTWYDRDGKVLGTTGAPGNYQGLTLSPDGTRAALYQGSIGQASSIWLLDLPQGTSTRFVFGSASDTSPVWSPDGNRIIFSSNRDGHYNLYRKLASGGKEEDALLKSSEDKFPASWSRDGRFLLYAVDDRKTKANIKANIWVLPMEGDHKPVPFASTEFNEYQARFSPDGHWVAYTSDESGRMEVYVRSFSMNPAGTAVEAGGKWLISSKGGSAPRWRSDGRELYYQSIYDGRLMAVEIVTTPVFRAGTPRPLGLVFPLDTGTPWDTAADGKRFLVAAESGKPEPYTVVLNWQTGLKK